MEAIKRDKTGNVFFGQLHKTPRRAPIEPLLKKLISLRPAFVGEIWKSVVLAGPTCVIDTEKKAGLDCLKNQVKWDSRTGPRLVS